MKLSLRARYFRQCCAVVAFHFIVLFHMFMFQFGLNPFSKARLEILCSNVGNAIQPENLINKRYLSPCYIVSVS